MVSTHSRPKAAASLDSILLTNDNVSTHSRPKAAANYANNKISNILVSTHSRPKAAALPLTHGLSLRCRFNTQPPEGGCYSDPVDPVYF